MASSAGMSTPSAVMGQVMGRLAACIFMMSRPVAENTSAAMANKSMNQRQAAPVWRPLCRSFSQAIQPRSVCSYSRSPVSRSMRSQASPPGRGRET